MTRTQQPAPKPKDGGFGIVKLNLQILVVLAIAILSLDLLLNDSGYKGVGYLLGMMYLVSIQAGLNFLLSICFGVMKKTEKAKEYFLSVVAVGLIGGGACFAAWPIVGM